MNLNLARGFEPEFRLPVGLKTDKVEYNHL